jgi:hypothetical protein
MSKDNRSEALALRAKLHEFDQVLNRCRQDLNKFCDASGNRIFGEDPFAKDDLLELFISWAASTPVSASSKGAG